ncbi:Crp/Fnr family transcriptional regulator [Crateriforma spongiae]|uniref:Crp/Fnr family transcriptional regulator n=1 Tax=Crateriforma spongiae TaxID=2724528 RepID=UPI0014450D2B|nr:cyclic nucleotide-binding domain-containing protein [Crateriforma spongiae]
MSDDRVELLRRMPAFGGLKPESLQLLLSESTQLHTAAGEYFFHEGDRGDCVYILESGSVTVQRIWHDQTFALGHLGPGDCFGEMALIDFCPRSASVYAESDCQTIQIPTRSLGILLRNDVEQYAMIMMNLGREVSRRLRVADDALFQLRHAGTAGTACS